MNSNKSSQFVSNLSKPLLLRVLRLNYHEDVDENSSIEELRELLQRKLTPIVSSEPQLESEPEPQVDVSSGDVTPVQESSGAKKILKRPTMGDDIKYRLNVDDWDTFVERMELYFDVNDTPEEKWVAEILTRVNEDSFKMIKNLALPRKPKDLSFEELVQLVSSHLNPKPSQQAERFKFSKARQYPNEPVNKFVARLKNLSLNCNFDNLEESLKDQFVNGVKSDEIRAECFQKSDLTFQEAVEMANSREQAVGVAGGGRGGWRGRGGQRGGGRGGAQGDRGGHSDRGASRGRGNHHQGQAKKEQSTPQPQPQPNVTINVVAQNKGDGKGTQKRGGGQAGQGGNQGGPGGSQGGQGGKQGGRGGKQGGRGGNQGGRGGGGGGPPRGGGRGGGAAGGSGGPSGAGGVLLGLLDLVTQVAENAAKSKPKPKDKKAKDDKSWVVVNK